MCGRNARHDFYIANLQAVGAFRHPTFGRSWSYQGMSGPRRSGVCSSFETVDQGICLKWLSEKADRTAGCGFGFQVRLSVRSDHDDRPCGTTACEQPLQIKPAHAGHVNVSDDAVTRSFTIHCDKFFRGCETPDAVSQRTQRFNERHSEGFVIINDRD
jgi:hypothetical protein